MSKFIDAVLFRKRWVIEIVDTKDWNNRVEIMRVSFFICLLLYLIIRRQESPLADRYGVKSYYEPGK